ncbi:hypothetical protein KP004_12035 [Geomonas oryzisoli]|uniref:UDP-3-O-(3-hydroxymyristoyl)glucosamine N-acyltransferase n=1 Tax=Geomonas oryzisoli TaxID=2847992 RepID=A0ABX8J1D0_9BACT|nr:DapH/DapD/GlmU-related protein [Geomonas oryzisoli]QWV91955.1 hypothetical protein KP004_12035 [Geomonas oryzisoli]
MRDLFAADIAGFLGKPLHGADVPVVKPADLKECGGGDLVWVRSLTPERIAAVVKGNPALIICDQETAPHLSGSHIVSDNPRLDFIKVLTKFFLPRKTVGIHPTALVSPDARIGSDVIVGAYTRIEGGVEIGEGCEIGSGVVIEGNVSLGKRCRIKSNSVIGAQGFGFEYDDDGSPLHFPHLGRIVIEDDVWIGACSSVEIASLGATLIRQGSKIDDLVQVGHNVTIGRNTLVMANVVICGCAVIGERCWIAPNSVVKQKVIVGDRAVVGLGSVVLKDVQDGATVAGVPSRQIHP